MHADTRKLPNNSHIEGDICIVGAGAAGVSIALDWIESGYKVILLEGGGFEFEQKLQDLYRGKSTGQKYYPLHGTRLHYFGGTTGHWAGMCSPFDEIDFVERDWVPESGWPYSKQELDPYYAKAQEVLNLGPYEYDLEHWQKEEADLTPFPLNDNIVYPKMWQFSQARFGKLYKEDILKAKSIHLYTYANVVDIVAEENMTLIKELKIKNHEGKEHTVRANQFIMACGAIQNARMLLASNSQVESGLGNDHDLVGRYFMEHLEIATGQLWLFNSFSDKLYTRWGKPRAELAISKQSQIEHKILNGTLSLTELSVAKHIVPRMELLQVDDYNEAVERFFGNMEESEEKAKSDQTLNINKAYEFQIRIEQAPNPSSRITLGNDRDALGVPRIVFNWDLTELDKDSIRKINWIVGEEMGKANLGRVKLEKYLQDPDDYSWPSGTNAGWHHMGTTRMNNDPKKGVVDEHCQVHGIDNLYVAGSGCYPTSGASNPTLTLVALSLKLSEHLKSKVKNKEALIASS